jgi:hypothetical protein
MIPLLAFARLLLSFSVTFCKTRPLDFVLGAACIEAASPVAAVQLRPPATR